MCDMKVGLQLYSIRDDMEKDMDKTLGEVKAMGYDYVEFAGYFGKSADEVAALLKKHDLKCISVHQTYDLFLKEGQPAVDYLKTIGVKYCAIPWLGVDCHKGHEKCEKSYAEIQEVGELLKKNGIQMLYHNHDFEFEKFEGKYLLDWLYDTFSADILQTEIDTCWVHYAGVDPAEYVRKYTGRAPVVHLKDFVCKKLSGGPVYALISEDGSEMKASKLWDETGFEFRPVGEGIQNIKSIIDAAKDAGAEYLIVEEDQCPTASPLDSARISRENLKKLGY